MTETSQKKAQEGVKSSDSMTRRTFLKLMMGFSAVISTLPLTPALRFFISPPKEISSTGVKIANKKDLAEGSTMVFFYPEEDAQFRSFLIHLSKEYQEEAEETGSNPYIVDGFVAYNTVCPHLQCPIELPDDDVLICPCHGGFLSVVDGSVLGGPIPRPLPIIKLEIDESTGDIYATELIGKVGYGRDV